MLTDGGLEAFQLHLASQGFGDSKTGACGEPCFRSGWLVLEPLRGQSEKKWSLVAITTWCLCGNQGMDPYSSFVYFLACSDAKV